MHQNKDIKLFYSYAHEDEEYKDTLEKHLSTLRRQGLISEWHDRMILAGDKWSDEIDHHLESANIILLLVSSDFISSDYCYEKEMDKAIKLHQEGKARVVPIIIRPVDWKDTPFSKFQALPKNAKPVSTWEDKDLAFSDISKNIRLLITQRNKADENNLKNKPNPSDEAGDLHNKKEDTKQEVGKDSTFFKLKTKKLLILIPVVIFTIWNSLPDESKQSIIQTFNSKDTNIDDKKLNKKVVSSSNNTTKGPSSPSLMGATFDTTPSLQRKPSESESNRNNSSPKKGCEQKIDDSIIDDSPINPC